MRVRDIFETHFTISTKVAIFSEDRSSVIVMKYGNGAYGLPGGHMEKGEHPDETIAREVVEELGITIARYERRDFFFRNKHKNSMILAYRAYVDRAINLMPPHPDKEHGIWLTRSEVENETRLSNEYREFILAQWNGQG